MRKSNQNTNKGPKQEKEWDGMGGLPFGVLCSQIVYSFCSSLFSRWCRKEKQRDGDGTATSHGSEKSTSKVCIGSC